MGIGLDYKELLGFAQKLSRIHQCRREQTIP